MHQICEQKVNWISVNCSFAWACMLAETGNTAAEKVAKTEEAAKETSDELASKAKEKASTAKETTEELASKAEEKASKAKERTEESVKSAAEKAKEARECAEETTKSADSGGRREGQGVLAPERRRPRERGNGRKLRK